MCAEFIPGKAITLEELLAGVIIIKKIIRNDFAGRVFPRGLAPILIPEKETKGGVLIESEFSLIPAWWNPETAEKKTKNNRPVFATHNARIESITEKPAFRDSFQKRHCLVPIETFFESSLFGNKFPGNRIQISKMGEVTKPLLGAGCYSEWIDASTGEVVNSFTIITSVPSKGIFEAGHDRMPIFLDVQDATEWLFMEKEKPLAMKNFLLSQTVNSKLELEISVDRELKEGWGKNSPGEKEILELRKIVIG